ncbi:MAG: glucokinase [Parvularculaceae bacterium]
MNAARRLLVADIGGTHARFAIVERRGAAVAILRKASFESRRFDAIDAAARAFLDGGTKEALAGALFAVAAPILGDEIVFTNSPWRFSTAALAARLGVKKLAVVNDFAALARGAVEARGEDIVPIKSGEALPGAPVAVLGPGTGLGLGLVLRDKGEVRVLATQGGHAAFAPSDEREIAVLRVLRRDETYLSFEEGLSGRGLVNLHRALCSLAGVSYEALAPEQITEAALRGGAPLAREAVDMFCAILGTFAGDAALIAGARGGVILAGGILPRIEPLLRASKFTQRFVTRDSMTDYMKAIPVFLLTSPDAALVGAALLAP